MSNEALNDSWDEYRRLVLDLLDKTEESIKDIQSKISLLERTSHNNKEELQKIISQESQSIKEHLQEIISNNKDDSIKKTHELEIRLNTIETKLYIYSALIGGGVTILTNYGQKLLDYLLK